MKIITSNKKPSLVSLHLLVQYVVFCSAPARDSISWISGYPESVPVEPGIFSARISANFELRIFPFLLPAGMKPFIIMTLALRNSTAEFPLRIFQQAGQSCWVAGTTHRIGQASQPVS